MRLYQVVVATTVLSSLVSAEVFAQSQRKTCPRPTQSERALSDSEFQAQLTKEIKIQTANMNRNYVEEFLYEYAKFPTSLRQEMNKQGATINLVQGEGVTVDPSWGGSMYTKDGRDWSKVPGSGGAVYSFPKNPTRIVVNHIYDRHGSVNLILHEHGHTLDYLYEARDLSGSKAWKGLIENEQNQNVMRGLCGYYCLTDARESLAELFAYYHACETTKQHLEQVLPEVATFFRNLTNVKAFKRADKGLGPEREEEQQRPRVRRNNGPRDTTPTPSSERPRRRRSLRSFFNDLGDTLQDIFDPEAN